VQSSVSAKLTLGAPGRTCEVEHEERFREVQEQAFGNVLAFSGH